jgi:putative endonuclease
MDLERFFVYILASRSRVLYTGMTRDLVSRVHQHRCGQIPGFTQKYHVTRLVYFEETSSARTACARERQIKGWSREKKLRLIETTNAGWLDLAANWFENGVGPSVAIAPSG